MDDTSYKKLLTANETKVGRGLVSSSLELLGLSNTTSYELHDLAARTPDVGPEWTSKPRAISATLGQRLATWTQQTLRSFRLLLPMAVGPWKKKKEQPKIALYTGRVPILTGLLVHVLPLAACITLIYLNITSYFVSTHVSTLTFQFLAKFLELLTQASLGSAVFAYLRALYTGPKSVPFGALFAGLQITSISYLWSLEFAGVVASKEFRRTRKLSFLLLVPLSVVLAAGVGPSIAIALTPTLGNFYGGRTVAWINATEEQIFPSNANSAGSVYNFSSSCSTGDCARYGWETAITLAHSATQLPYVSPEASLVLTQDALPNRELRWNSSASASWSALTSATVTIPSKVVAWSLAVFGPRAYRPASLWYVDNMNFTTTGRQPSVTANCTPAYRLNMTSVQFSWDDFQGTLRGSILQSESLREFDNTNDTGSFHWMFIDRDDSVVQWPSKFDPSVWVFVRYPPGREYPYPDSTPFGLCAIYAGYAQVQNTISITDTSSESLQLVSSQTNQASASTITVPATWLNRTLPSLSTLLNYGLLEGDSATFLATSLAISMAQWPKQILSYPSDIPDIQEAMYMNPGIVIGSPQGPQDISHKWHGTSAGDHVLYPESEYADAEGKYRLRIDVSSHGYGYHINQTTKVIAISVLAAYCLYISIFMILMLTLNRVHSNAWDSIGELTALAIMSRPDGKLRNTSAGIETVALFKLPMNIRANDNNHLEILFGDDEGGTKSVPVEKDKEYE